MSSLFPKEEIMKKGILVKRMGGLCYVFWPEKNKVVECVYRGRHRLSKEDVFPGDRVAFTIPSENDRGVVEQVLDRTNLLARPPVANVTQMICVIALKSPNPNFLLLDKLLATAGKMGLGAAVCINKMDLVSPEKIHSTAQMYKGLGYPVIITSAKSKRGLGALARVLRGNLSVLAGQSGVGKSSLLNQLKPEADLRVGEISPKLKSGKHTTKHVELIMLPDGGFVADTPGFSKLGVVAMAREEVSRFFPELKSLQPQCRFSDCLHRSEPGCAVKAAVQCGSIFKHRYDNYLAILEEVILQERSYR